jgi:predicted nucleic acid-binding protein
MKSGPWLLDTGFLVGLINASDPAHSACAAIWDSVRGPFLTTEGVLVETAHLVRKTRGALTAAWGLLRSVNAVLVPQTRYRVDRTIALVETWADVPMDYVDGSLVALAEETEILRILTLDRRGFSAYRVEGQRFECLP